MDRSRPLPHRFLAQALAFALFTLVLAAVACDSGTQEPDAPAASNEFGAAPSTTDPASSAAAQSAAVQPRGDGSIAPERFPTDLPEGIAAEIPDNFPSNIPIYPGAQAAQGKGANLEGLAVSGVQLLSNDTAIEIFNFYEAELKANGWEITESKSDPMSSSISATNGSCKAVLFILASSHGGSDIFVVNEC